VGTQYRSMILYHDQEQTSLAEASKQARSNRFSSPIVTEIVPATNFFPPPEGYHQRYLEKRGRTHCSPRNFAFIFG